MVIVNASGLPVTWVCYGSSVNHTSVVHNLNVLNYWSKAIGETVKRFYAMVGM